MARSRRLPLVLAASVLAALLAMSPAPSLALPGGGGDAAALAAQAKALREKAAELRAAGSAEDAEHLEKKAEAVEARIADARAAEAKCAEVKARIAELRATAERAKAEGRMDDAQAACRLAEEAVRSLERMSPPKWDTELVRGAAELREKAGVLRARGSVEDAAHLEEKAARVEKALELRRESNEFERRGKEAKAAGNEEEAHALMEKSGRAWKEGEALLGAGSAEKRKEGDIGSLLRGSPDEVRARLVALRDAARLLREAGVGDRADALERQAAAAERALEGRKASEIPDIEALRAQAEALRRRVAELEEAIRRLETR